MKNLDLVRSIYAALERGDLSAVERAGPEALTRVGYGMVFYATGFVDRDRTLKAVGLEE